MRNSLVIVGFGIALAVHAGEPFSLKGYEIGTEMNGCPAGTVSEQQTGTNEIMCSLGPTTLANQAAVDHAVKLKDNKISGVMFKMAERGRYANRSVVEALKAKYGKPAKEKPHLNEFTWQQGSLVLAIDGYKGLLLLMDLERARKTQREAAANNKDDL